MALSTAVAEDDAELALVSSTSLRAAEPRASRAPRVLVAMEHTLFVETLRVALVERGGFDVVGSCTDLTTLATTALRARPDVVIIDVAAARTDGVQALRDVRAALPSAALLVLSASPSPDVVSQVMTAGAAGFLSLEADMAEVVSAVRSTAEGQVVLSGRRLEALVRHLSRSADSGTPSGPGGRLTERETEVLSLIVGGASTPAIASALFISTHTARTHVQNVLVKLGVHSRLEAAAYAARNNLVPTPA